MRRIFSLLLITFLFSQFSNPVKAESLESKCLQRFRRLTVSEIRTLDLSEGYKSSSLKAALRNSLSFYNATSTGTKFRMGREERSLSELKKSLLALEVIWKIKAKSIRLKRLRQEFNFWTTSGASRAENRTLFTAYYTPVLRVRRRAREGYHSPVFARPKDLLGIELGLFNPLWKGQKLMGRKQGRKLVPYDTRYAILQRDTLRGRAKVLFYINQVDSYFLQMQGAGINRFMFLQDAGGAIKGPRRADYYMGAGSEAERKAEVFKEYGRLILILKKK